MGSIRGWLNALMGRDGGQREGASDAGEPRRDAARAEEEEILSGVPREFEALWRSSDASPPHESRRQMGAGRSSDSGSDSGSPHDQEPAPDSRAGRAAMCFKACTAGDEAAALELLGADRELRASMASGRSEESQTMLMAAAFGGLEKVAEILLPHSDPLAADDKGFTALMFAAWRGHEPIVRMLAAVGGAQLNDERGMDAIQLAAMAGHPSVAEFLAPYSTEASVGTAAMGLRSSAKGAKSSNRLGAMAMAMSARRRGLGEEAIELLQATLDGDLARVALFAAPDTCLATMDDGSTALMVALGRCALNAGAEAIRWRRIAGLLLPLSDGRSATAEGETALMRAAEGGEAWAVAALLPSSDANAKDSKGATALRRAVERADLECVALLAPATSKWVTDADGLTPLMIAATNGDAECMELLIPHSAINQRDRDGRNALMRVVAAGSLAGIAKLAPLTAANAKTKRGLDAWEIANKDHPPGGLRDAVMEALYPHIGRKIPEFELIRAARAGDAAKVSANAKEFGRRAGRRGETALMAAAERGHMPCAQILLPHSHPHALDDMGRAAWMLAAKNGHLDSMSMLLRAVVDRKGRVKPAELARGIDMAAEAGHVDCVEAIRELHPDAKVSGGVMAKVCAGRMLPEPQLARLSFHADSKWVSWDGQSLMMLAAQHGLCRVVEALLAKSDPNQVDDGHWTALRHAIEGRSEACIELLAPETDLSINDHSNADWGELPRDHSEWAREAIDKALAKKAANVERDELATLTSAPPSESAAAPRPKRL